MQTKMQSEKSQLRRLYKIAANRTLK